MTRCNSPEPQTVHAPCAPVVANVSSAPAHGSGSGERLHQELPPCSSIRSRVGFPVQIVEGVVLRRWHGTCESQPHNRIDLFFLYCLTLHSNNALDIRLIANPSMFSAQA